jgi:hypothetical protein
MTYPYLKDSSGCPYCEERGIFYQSSDGYLVKICNKHKKYFIDKTWTERRDLIAWPELSRSFP